MEANGNRFVVGDLLKISADERHIVELSALVGESDDHELAVGRGELGSSELSNVHHRPDSGSRNILSGHGHGQSQSKNLLIAPGCVDYALIELIRGLDALPDA